MGKSASGKKTQQKARIDLSFGQAIKKIVKAADTKTKAKQKKK